MNALPTKPEAARRAIGERAAGRPARQPHRRPRCRARRPSPAMCRKVAPAFHDAVGAVRPPAEDRRDHGVGQSRHRRRLEGGANRRPSAAATEITQSRTAVETAVRAYRRIDRSRPAASRAGSARCPRRCPRWPRSRPRSRRLPSRPTCSRSNATIEAARAGAMRAAALRWVAAESEESRGKQRARRRQQIGDTVRGLDGQVGSLIGESSEASGRAKHAGEGAAQIQKHHRPRPGRLWQCQPGDRRR